MSVTVRARLPKSDQNGLAHLEAAWADALMNGTADDIVIVGIVRPDTVEMRPHDEDNPRLVKTVMLHVEAVAADGDRTTVDKILRAIYEVRTGKKELPFEADDIKPVDLDGDPDLGA